MSAISAVWLYVGWGAVHFETNYGLMQHSPFEIKEKLLKALDKEYNVVDMATVVEIVSILERTAITKEALETTRLGRYINELRRKTSNDSLARRAKDLVRRWRDMILPTPAAPVDPPTAPSVPQVAATHQNGAAPPQPPPATSPVLSGATTTTPTTTDVPRTHASNKRLRKDAAAAASSPPDGVVTSPDLVAAPPAKKAKVNGASLPPPPLLLPPDELSRDGAAVTQECEIVTIVDDDYVHHHETDTNDSKLSSTSSSSKTKKSRQKEKKSSSSSNPTTSSDRRRSKTGRRGLGGDDILKEKIASIARTPRVKTTQELVADLRSRSNSDNNNKVVQNSTTTVDSNDVAANKGSSETVKGGHSEGEVLSRNKTEHIAKFLRSQVADSDDDVVVVVEDEQEEQKEEKEAAKVDQRPTTKDHHHHHHHHHHKRAKPGERDTSEAPERTLQEILARLPPLDVDSIVWDESPPVSAPSTPRPITGDDVHRLHTQHVENLNGNFDHAPLPPEEQDTATSGGGDNFREWHETVSRTSYNGELLHILPYCVID